MVQNSRTGEDQEPREGDVSSSCLNLGSDGTQAAITIPPLRCCCPRIVQVLCRWGSPGPLKLVVSNHTPHSLIPFSGSQSSCGHPSRSRDGRRAAESSGRTWQAPARVTWFGRHKGGDDDEQGVNQGGFWPSRRCCDPERWWSPAWDQDWASVGGESEFIW